MNLKIYSISASLIITGIIFSSCSPMSSGEPVHQKMVASLRKNSSATRSSETAEAAENISARFEIYTHGTKRIFTNAMYHQQSEDVFIEASDPSLIQVKKAGTTWNDFFTTLPFSLDAECLVTGTGQNFCTGKQGTLRFFLNENETPTALDLEIQPSDHLKVVYE